MPEQPEEPEKPEEAEEVDGNVHAVGQKAVRGVKVKLASGLAKLLRRDPERLATAVEMGLVSRNWLDRPGEEPITAAAPMEVIERYLQRSVEQKPSILASLGLSTLQILSWRGDDVSGEGVPSLLTVAFTDLEGFTTYTASEGDDAASHLLAEHHRAVGPVVRSRGGRVVKRLGDGLLLTFPEPEACVLTCLELVDAQPEPLRLRAGVHQGDVVVTRDDVLGHVVNVAARVAELARGSEVLATADLCGSVGELPGVHFTRPRRRRLKGLDGTVSVCRVERAVA